MGGDDAGPLRGMERRLQRSGRDAAGGAGLGGWPPRGEQLPRPPAPPRRSRSRRGPAPAVPGRMVAARGAARRGALLLLLAALGTCRLRLARAGQCVSVSPRVCVSFLPRGCSRIPRDPRGPSHGDPGAVAPTIPTPTRAQRPWVLKLAAPGRVSGSLPAPRPPCPLQPAAGALPRGRGRSASFSRAARSAHPHGPHGWEMARGPPPTQPHRASRSPARPRIAPRAGQRGAIALLPAAADTALAAGGIGAGLLPSSAVGWQEVPTDVGPDLGAGREQGFAGPALHIFIMGKKPTKNPKANTAAEVTKPCQGAAGRLGQAGVPRLLTCLEPLPRGEQQQHHCAMGLNW